MLLAIHEEDTFLKIFDLDFCELYLLTLSTTMIEVLLAQSFAKSARNNIT